MFFRYRNIVANLLPAQVQKTYADVVLERLTSMQVSQEPDHENVMRPTIVLFHPNNTYDTFRWTVNPVKSSAYAYAWVRTEAAQLAEAA